MVLRMREWLFLSYLLYNVPYFIMFLPYIMKTLYIKLLCIKLVFTEKPFGKLWIWSNTTLYNLYLYKYCYSAKTKTADFMYSLGRKTLKKLCE